MGTSSITIAWSDFDANFTKGMNSDITYFKNINSIKQSIKNILNTPRGKDLMDPYYGTGLYEYIFEILDDLSINYLKDVIKTDILNNEPRVLINNIDIKKTSDSSIYISIIFTVKESKLEDSTTFVVTL
jgi:hypothetical protein